MAKTAKRPGRPTTLSEPQRVEIGQRLASGESMRSVSTDLHIPYTTINRNFSDRVPKIRDVARTLADAETALAELPIPDQRAARTLADQMKSISASLAKAGENGAKIAERLSGAALKRSDKALDEEGNLIEQALLDVAVLSKTANLAASIGTDLVKASNKDRAPEEKSLEDLLEEANQRGNKR